MSACRKLVWNSLVVRHRYSVNLGLSLAHHNGILLRQRIMNGHISNGKLAEESSSLAGGDGGGNIKRGALIVFEGCDKAGKSTQCKLLVDALNQSGRTCHLFRFPDRTTEIGKVIDEYLKCTKSLSDETIHLLFSSNRWELVPSIRKKLENGESVIVDRYAFSGVAFSAAKDTLDLEWCKSPDRGLPQPDKVFFLNLSEEAASERGDYGQERYEKKEFQRKVKDVFLQIQDPKYWEIIDANRAKEELHDELYKRTVECIMASESKPIVQLWKN